MPLKKTSAIGAWGNQNDGNGSETKIVMSVERTTKLEVNVDNMLQWKSDVRNENKET
jgi:hypothetical protein